MAAGAWQNEERARIGQSWSFPLVQGGNLAERGRDVAARTLTAEAALMHVVAGMAGGAVAIGGQPLAGLVAIGALRTRMRAGERELRLAVVEIPDAPVARAVAAAAIVAVTALMAVVLAMTAHAFARGVRVQLGLMAIGALSGAMFADQHKLAAIVTEAALLPVVFLVAIRAATAQTRFVLVVFQVAIEAFMPRLDLFDWLHMAGLAFGYPVFAEQGKFGRLVVIELGLFPITGVVAIGTLFAVAAFVTVILAVAIDTSFGGGAKMRGIGMASAAERLDVATYQWEFGVAVVELGRRFPFVGVVTGLAARAQGGLVPVVFEVAATARAGRLLVVALGAMAVLARRIAVRAEQHKAGLAVIEARLFPILYGMALGAVDAHRALVEVIFAMTTDASVFQTLGHRALDVASLALALGMRAEQLELGATVIEFLDMLPVAGVMALGALLA